MQGPALSTQLLLAHLSPASVMTGVNGSDSHPTAAGSHAEVLYVTGGKANNPQQDCAVLDMTSSLAGLFPCCHHLRGYKEFEL